MSTPAIAMVTSHGHRHWLARAMRPVAVGSGSVLYALGLAGSVAFLALGVVLTAWRFGSEQDPADLPLEPGLMLALWAVSAAVMIGGLRYGRRLVRGRRLSVLYLRRFRDPASTRALTTAARRSLGGRWRMVTLDDEELVPVGVGATTRTVFGAARLAGRVPEAAVAVWQRLFQVAALAAFASGALIVAEGGWESLLEPLDLSGMEGFPLVPAPAQPLSWSAPSVFYVSVAAVFLLGQLTIVALGLMLLSLALLPLFVAGSSWSDAERWASGNVRKKVTSERDVEDTVSTIRQMREKVLAPRLLVLTVRTAIWQHTVRRLAQAVNICLVDVSDPSEHLLWELDLLAQRPGTTCVFVGEQADLLRLAAGARLGSDPAAARLAALLAGREVLTYSADRRGIRRFARELRLTLQCATSA
jgi:hypothetical protein